MPTVGSVVRYRNVKGEYTLPAIVLATEASLWQPGVERGDVPPLTPGGSHVHLRVFTPGELGSYVEYDVPRDDTEQQARSWAWPHRERRRRTDPLVVVCSALSALALIVTLFVSYTVLANADQIETTTENVERAVCPVIGYAERQADNIRTRDGDDSTAAAELEQLGADMRATGVKCPPREAP